VVITDPKYYMICVVTYITEHEQGGTGLVIGIQVGRRDYRANITIYRYAESSASYIQMVI